MGFFFALTARVRTFLKSKNTQNTRVDNVLFFI